MPSWLTALGQFLAELIARLVKDWRAEKTSRRVGELEERERQHEAADELIDRMEDAAGAVAGADVDRVFRASRLDSGVNARGNETDLWSVREAGVRRSQDPGSGRD